MIKEKKKKKICEMNVEDIFINLTVLSKIAPGDKLLIDETGKHLNIDTSIFPPLTRWWRGINRMEALNFITNILNMSFEIQQSYVHEKNDQNLFRLTTDLKNALNGLTNLKLTYPDDKLVQSEIDVMMENIRSRLYGYRNGNSIDTKKWLLFLIV